MNCANRATPRHCPSAGTEEAADDSALIGQDRALDAIRLSPRLGHRDFNLFVLGPAGSGRHSATRTLLRQQAASRAVPSDWVYVNNFEAAQKPRALHGVDSGWGQDRITSSVFCCLAANVGSESIAEVAMNLRYANLDSWPSIQSDMTKLKPRAYT